MSVHDALDAWRRGDLSTNEALRLSGAVYVAELDDLCRTCGVETVEPGGAQVAVDLKESSVSRDS